MGYLGSKAASGAYQKIIAAMPPHDTYIETHLGSGAVMVRKPAAVRSVGIDIDGEALRHFSIGHSIGAGGLQHVTLIDADAVEYLREFDFASAGQVLIYADPPYLPETRTSRARYRFEYTVEQHRELIAVLRSVPASVMISGYPSALYDELLGDWRSITFQVMTRGGVRTEQLWVNYPEGAAYDATFAGENYVDRQRIKRKAQRWADNYRAMSRPERLAIMSALQGVDASDC
ncbi:DNA adenine methylase [Dickeya dianthicola]|uniref:site-specific DNA-methyltransferase (adenine-specific) n=1 Tax=Dickeya dianthicola TaxID=204039 RepID=A0AAX1C5B8_9GAMM|nr:DNA adenine methylase [Dickeya dianthicola]ATO31567.1 (adenine-N6-)-methyltransferase-like protein [Dickeya dianthicola RNS04.9]MBT1430946.1 DNA adenine methylase [Dickeya dianthicola]MCA7005037.1 DNA adenine methylase [Dickeya dianthicola]MCI4001354.1 DNA adenine methylase [Dickeya dianthicola]MCI4031813.1 DNA adenine methylase [Dickeya dianthicola]